MIKLLATALCCDGCPQVKQGGCQSARRRIADARGGQRPWGWECRGGLDGGNCRTKAKVHASGVVWRKPEAKLRSATIAFEVAASERA